MDAYPRRAHFEYFSSMANPYMGVTVELDITDFCARIRELGPPLLPQPALVREPRGGFRARVPAADRRRAHRGVRLVPHLAHARPRGRHLLLLPAQRRREAAGRVHSLRLRRAGASPLAQSLDDGDGLDLYFISTLPWLSYTALVNPTPTPADSNPRLTWGKWFERGGRRILPFTALCNHALVDGAHLAQFFDALRAEMGGI